jgi:hypothetical protein
MSETDLSRRIREALRQLGCWVVRQQSSGRRGVRSVASGEPGLPDIQVLAPVHGFIEVKVPGGRLNANQELWHARARNAGLRVAVVHSVDEAVDVVMVWKKEAA